MVNLNDYKLLIYSIKKDRMIILIIKTIIFVSIFSNIQLIWIKCVFEN